MEELEEQEYGENRVDDMMVDFDYHVNAVELPDLFEIFILVPFMFHIQIYK